EILREVTGLHAGADDSLAAGDRFDARQQLHHRGLSRSVGTDQRDSRAALDDQIDAVVNRERAVAFDRALEFENPPRAPFAFRKRNCGRLLRSFRRLEAFELVELLDAALHQTRLARLVAEAADETLHVLDFEPLPLERRHFEREAFLARNQIARVAADVF